MNDLNDRALDLIQETADRTRRIETKLTRALASQGFDVQTSKPLWVEPDMLIIPSRSVSLGDCLTTVPLPYTGYMRVVCDGQVIAHIIPTR